MPAAPPLPPPRNDDAIAALRRALGGRAAPPATTTPPTTAPPVEQARALLERTLGLLDRAGTDPKGAAAVLAQARECLKLLAQLTGDLASGASVQLIFEHPAAKDFVARLLGHVEAVFVARLGPEGAREALAELWRRAEAEQRAAVAATPPKAGVGRGPQLGA